MMLKSTGMVRRIDDLGRVVLPIELRRVMDIRDGDPLEIYVDGEKIILKKYERGCIFCGSLADDARAYRGKIVCADCAKAIAEA